MNSTSNYGFIAVSDEGASWLDLVLQPTEGNVGIATTSPDYKLHVEGTGYFANEVIVGTPTADTHATLNHM